MSSSGINELKENILAVSFKDACPYCGSTDFKMESKPLNKEQVKVRYICSSCGFTCPVVHDISNPESCTPISFNEVNKFISTFGTEDD